MILWVLACLAGVESLSVENVAVVFVVAVNARLVVTKRDQEGSISQSVRFLRTKVAPDVSQVCRTIDDACRVP